jgi:hypothetical protein
MSFWNAGVQSGNIGGGLEGHACPASKRPLEPELALIAEALRAKVCRFNPDGAPTAIQIVPVAIAIEA